jgi:hypothetical protein
MWSARFTWSPWRSSSAVSCSWPWPSSPLSVPLPTHRGCGRSHAALAGHPRCNRGAIGDGRRDGHGAPSVGTDRPAREAHAGRSRWRPDRMALTSPRPAHPRRGDLRQLAGHRLARRDARSLAAPKLRRPRTHAATSAAAKSSRVGWTPPNPRTTMTGHGACLGSSAATEPMREGREPAPSGAPITMNRACS